MHMLFLYLSPAGSFKQKVKDCRTASTSSETPSVELVQSEPDVSLLDDNIAPINQEPELLCKVQALLQMLYSLQAVVTQQDSFVEVQKERERQFRQLSSKGNLLLEQEKQRNFEKQREELVNVQKLQEQLRNERQRWEREREKQQKEIETTETLLRSREEQSKMEKERLDQDRKELETQREAYQRDLERLRESQRAVEKDKERLEQLKRIKKSNVGPVHFSPDLVQVTVGLTHSTSFNGEGMLNLEVPGLPTKPTAKSTMSMSAADYLERPEVTRRDSSSTDTRPALKHDVPIHLLSATNQIQKQALLTKQQIPTKLAALTKGSREKSGRGKASHRTESSASVDHRSTQSKFLGKEDNTLWSRTSAVSSPMPSQSVFQQDNPGQTEPFHESPPYSSLHRPNSSNLLQAMVPPPFPPPPPPSSTEDEPNREEVIFF
ncbi:rho guanine nucleotide exchange factor 18 [Pelobates cultripes]|uniref:Rho guanine nucleotide exchange factor 18 n=1 Tax=Pelobates cultripes TaxID=61616 RepID=A0AAD1S5D6_PELCU|nr:rho guanine nucleotide exchange factor 18 [Pelobates cultripes]